MIGLAVDVVVEREDSFLASMGILDPWNQLILLSVLTFAIWGLESLFRYFYGVLWRNLAQTVQHELRLETFSHVQKQGMGWFDERQKGDILAILNDDINQLERFLDKGANDLLQVSTTVVVVGAVFIAISGKLLYLQYYQSQLLFGALSNTSEVLSQSTPRLENPRVE